MTTGDNIDGDTVEAPAGQRPSDTPDIRQIKTLAAKAGSKARELDALLFALVELLERDDA